MNPLKALHDFEQSVWLDYVRRSLITSGELHRLVNDGLLGVTSNPSVFEKAISGSDDYTTALKALERRNLDTNSIYEHLAIRDIQDAADAMWPVYENTNRRGGYVSLEVSPSLAGDTQGTTREARRLWDAIARDNLMVKVPATAEGIPAIQQLISEGINVNVTLLFSVQRYELVAEAYIAGLEQLEVEGGDVTCGASVASFFISCIDTVIDTIVMSRLKTATSPTERLLLRAVLGKVAIANAKLAYQRYKELFRSERWQRLKSRGAQTQRLLWASTGPKNPEYRDVIYVEELIGPDTVTTMSPTTLEAFRDHGLVRVSLVEDIDAARDIMQTLEPVGISMDDVADKLLAEGLDLLTEAFQKQLVAVDKKRKDKIATIVGNI